MSVIEEIHRRLPDTHLVMHGSSSVPENQEIINRYGGEMVVAPLQLQRRGPELRIGAAAPMPKPDARLVQRLIEARTRVADYLDPHRGLSLSAIARRAGANVGDVSRSLQLAFLAPDLVEAILDCTQPVSLSPPKRLKRPCELPLIWDEQRAMLGVDELETGALSRRSGAGSEARRGELA